MFLSLGLPWLQSSSQQAWQAGPLPFLSLVRDPCLRVTRPLWTRTVSSSPMPPPQSWGFSKDYIAGSHFSLGGGEIARVCVWLWLELSTRVFVTSVRGTLSWDIDCFRIISEFSLEWLLFSYGLWKPWLFSWTHRASEFSAAFRPSRDSLCATT